MRARALLATAPTSAIRSLKSGSASANEAVYFCDRYNGGNRAKIKYLTTTQLKI